MILLAATGVCVSTAEKATSRTILTDFTDFDMENMHLGDICLA